MYMSNLKYLLLILGLLLFSCNTEDPSAGSDTDWVVVSAGLSHTCGLHEDGTVECWGCEEEYDFGQCTVPDDTFISVDAGGFHTCGINSEGYAICWGCTGTYFGTNVNKGQCNPPGWVQYEILDMGFFHSYAMRRDQTIQCWGCTDEDESWNVGQCWND